VLGIQVEISRGFTELLVECDSKFAISLIRDGCPSTHLCYQVVAIINIFVNDGGVFSWKHIYWEANQVADLLQNMVFH